MARRWAWLKVIFKTGDDPMNEHWKPQPKVTNGGAAGTALGVIVAWVLSELVGLNVPETVAVAFGSVFTWLSIYLVPNR